MPQNKPTSRSYPHIHNTLSRMIEDSPLAFKVTGNCMVPLIKDGAIVQFQHSSHFYPGDILLYQSAPGRYAVHRYLGSYKRNGHLRFITKGDNSSKADPGFSPDLCLGKVCGGECKPFAVNIPLITRILSILTFSRVVLLVLTRKFFVQ